MPDLEIGEVLGDMCDSGLRIPRKVSENYEVTSYIQIDMNDECGEVRGACEVVKAMLKCVGYENYEYYINKHAVVVGTNHYDSYTAVYSYDYNLNIFTFKEKADDQDQGC